MMQPEVYNEGPSAIVDAVQYVQPPHADPVPFAVDAPTLVFDCDLKVKFEFDLDEDSSTDQQDVSEDASAGSMQASLVESVTTAATLAAIAMPGSRDPLLTQLLQSDVENADNWIMGTLKAFILPSLQKGIIMNIETEDIYDFLREHDVKDLASVRALLTIVHTVWRTCRNVVETELKGIKAGIISLQVRPQDYDIMLRFEQIRLVDRYVALHSQIRNLHDSVFYSMSLIVPENIFRAEYDMLERAAKLRNSEHDSVAALLDCLRGRDLHALNLTMLTKHCNLKSLESIGDELQAMTKELVQIPLLIEGYEVPVLQLKHYVRHYAKKNNRHPELQEAVSKSHSDDPLLVFEKLWVILTWVAPVLASWVCVEIMKKSVGR